MGSARIAFVPQLVLVIGAIGDDVAAILLAEYLISWRALSLPEEHSASSGQEKQRGRTATGAGRLGPSTTSPRMTPPITSGVRLKLGALCLRLGRPQRLPSTPLVSKMATRIQIGSHSPQDRSVRMRCSAWLVPRPADTATATDGAGAGGGVGGGAGVKVLSPPLAVVSTADLAGRWGPGTNPVGWWVCS